VEPRLAEFYRSSAAYHQMTSAAGGRSKTTHPQALLLEALADGPGPYLEVGCGSGEISCRLGRRAEVHGFDVSPLAVARARRRCPELERVRFRQADAARLPVAGASMAGAWAFEVLEHVWDPGAVVEEMIRALRPGGFLLLSFPNHFSLDHHLAKRPAARAADLGLAAARYLADTLSRRPFRNLEPDLAGEPYPDCDMITAIVPRFFLPRHVEPWCEVEFVDSTYLSALHPDHPGTLARQRLTGAPFLRHFGDHFLVLARKRPRAGAG
jgi:SAM-dependent methyltransferase